MVRRRRGRRGGGKGGKWGLLVERRGRIFHCGEIEGGGPVLVVGLGASVQDFCGVLLVSVGMDFLYRVERGEVAQNQWICVI